MYFEFHSDNFGTEKYGRTKMMGLELSETGMDGGIINGNTNAYMKSILAEQLGVVAAADNLAALKE